ncbi:hypothetical protein Ocin01_09492 [Orchesella cincta]|uniref:Uncharacterized protein n=1 Tax=Orchesella cincta TaxID=48709 RepID=A0A1D2MVT1_ORCCI|nr:hypothetical protein Ocin01_09492 [Orchesella cincta]
MHLQKLTLLTICMGMAAMAAPQAQQLQAQPQAQASAPVGQSRDAPVYSDSQYAASGYQAAATSAGQYTNGAAASYSQPQAQYAAAASSQGGYGGGGQPSGNGNGNAGYYYYYYPVQESKTDYAPAKEAYHPSDSYGIDPLGIISVLAIAGLVIAGLALLFPGWAYVKSDENVYYRSNNGAPSLLGLSKDDFLTLTSLVLAAIEGEDCIEKMMCDASKLVKKVKKADTFLRIMEDFAPTSVSGNIKKLRTTMKKSDECKNVSCGKKKVL